ncbi:MAG: hypothetical protein KGL70_05765 [Betaproteobacteria bacterium]|nr:hypothetical protein [Betaproteobacteria bacterium]
MGLRRAYALLLFRLLSRQVREGTASVRRCDRRGTAPTGRAASWVDSIGVTSAGSSPCWKLLAERPKALGLAVPGMPASAPGMDSPRPSPYQVLLFQGNGATRVYHAYS